MANLIDTIGIRQFLPRGVVDEDVSDFEAWYARMASDPKHGDTLGRVEDRIRDYFSQMGLPEEPTLYDHLLLSLRPTDLVATFNWDPLLFDSWERLSDRFGSENLADIAYLHGNVRVGYCQKHRVYGGLHRNCPHCKEALTPTPLLYPVADKEYEKDPYIWDCWCKLKSALDESLAITIFGYSAPSSDTAAKDLLQTAWNGTREREFESIFIIDVKETGSLSETWAPFIFTQHYAVQQDFYHSQLARYSRRSIEELIARTIEGRFTKKCPIPRCADWGELDAWFKPLVEAESRMHPG